MPASFLAPRREKKKIHTGMYTCRCIYISYVRKPLVPPRLCFVAHGACFLSCSAHSENHNLYIHVGVYLVYIKHVRAPFAATTASTSFFVDDDACFHPCSAQSLAVRFSASRESYVRILTASSRDRPGVVRRSLQPFVLRARLRYC